MKRKSLFLGWLCLPLLVLVAGFGPGWASEVSVEHRKLFTADATPVEPEKYEVEFAYRYAWADKVWDGEGRSGDRRRRQEQAAGLTLVAGLLRDLDFSIALDYLWIKDEENLGPTKGNGLGDLGLGIRYRFLNREDKKWELAWISALTVPSGSRSDLNRLGTGQEYWSWVNALVATKDWGRLTANGEIGYSFPFGDARGRARGSLSLNLAMGYQVWSWLQPELEMNFSKDFVSEGEAAQVLALAAGLVMPVHERLQIHLGVQQGIWGRNADQGKLILLTVKTAF
jgi:hypothetical protein